MPLPHKPTSLHTFITALSHVVTNQHDSVTVQTESVTLTISDPNGTGYGYSNRGRFNTSEVEAVLYTVSRPSGYSWAITHTVQALFIVDSGRFVSAHTNSRTHSPSNIQIASKRHPSQPFGWRGESLTRALKALEGYTTEAIEAKAAAEAERNEREDRREAERAEAKYQADLSNILTAREKAIATLRAAATTEVLDFFLPLPTKP